MHLTFHVAPDHTAAMEQARRHQNPAGLLRLHWVLNEPAGPYTDSVAAFVEHLGAMDPDTHIDVSSQLRGDAKMDWDHLDLYPCWGCRPLDASAQVAAGAQAMQQSARWLQEKLFALGFHQDWIDRQVWDRCSHRPDADIWDDAVEIHNAAVSSLALLRAYRSAQ